MRREDGRQVLSAEVNMETYPVLLEVIFEKAAKHSHATGQNFMEFEREIVGITGRFYASMCACASKNMDDDDYKNFQQAMLMSFANVMNQARHKILKEEKTKGQ